jgi:hypothetical protein
MKLITKININWPVIKTFNALKSPAMMQRVAWPLVIFKPVKPSIFPEQWQEEFTYRMNMYLLGFLPMGWQELKISSHRDEINKIYILKDVGPGWAVKWWDHQVVLKPISENITSYDEILELKTGLLGPIIWIGMNLLFKWRKYRWLKLTK